MVVYEDMVVELLVAKIQQRLIEVERILLGTWQKILLQLACVTGVRYNLAMQFELLNL